MLTGRHYQNAYVTRNIEAAVAGFQKHADIRQLMEIEVPVKLWTPQGEGEGIQKLAFVWVEDLQYELIQPVSGDVLKLYSDELPDDDSIKFHHICNLIEDWDAFMARVDEQEFPIAIKGDTGSGLKFIYLDTREWLGHYTEYCYMPPENWTQMGGR